LLIETGPDGIRVTATDMAVQLSEAVDREPRDVWSACVDAARLHALLQSLPRGSALDFSADADGLYITGGGTRARFSLLPVEGFPRFAAYSAPGAELDLDGAALADALGFCLHAAADDEARPALNGVFLHENHAVG
jgi:DNA polymerase-3 subunit beta